MACLLAPIPFLFYRYGGKIRQRSRFAPTGDSKTAEASKEGKRPELPASRSADRSSEDVSPDDEAGAKDLEKELSRGSGADPRDGDPYLDADGIEKAER